jgi:hypothetical protein
MFCLHYVHLTDLRRVRWTHVHDIIYSCPASAVAGSIMYAYSIRHLLASVEHGDSAVEQMRYIDVRCYITSSVTSEHIGHFLSRRKNALCANKTRIRHHCIIIVKNLSGA